MVSVDPRRSPNVTVVSGTYITYCNPSCQPLLMDIWAPAPGSRLPAPVASPRPRRRLDRQPAGWGLSGRCAASADSAGLVASIDHLVGAGLRTRVRSAPA